MYRLYHRQVTTSHQGTRVPSIRNVSLALWSSGDAPHELTACFCTDGASVPSLAQSVGAAIDRGHCRPVALIGVHSAPRQRSEEYLPGVAPRIFDEHAEFFVHELPVWLELEYGLAIPARQRTLFGVSNGGAFAVAIGATHPTKFGVVIAFSVARAPADLVVPPRSNPLIPKYYLAAGGRETEKPFRKHTLAIATRLRRRGAECVYAQRDAGHDFRFWRTELPLALSWAFGTPD